MLQTPLKNGVYIVFYVDLHAESKYLIRFNKGIRLLIVNHDFMIGYFPQYTAKQEWYISVILLCKIFLRRYMS